MINNNNNNNSSNNGRMIEQFFLLAEGRTLLGLPFEGKEEGERRERTKALVLSQIRMGACALIKREEIPCLFWERGEKGGRYFIL